MFIFSPFLINRWLWVFLNRWSSQQYPGNTDVSQNSILCHMLFLLYINYFPDSTICNILSMLMTDFIVWNFFSEKLTVKVFGLSFSSKLDWALTLFFFFFDKTGFKKSWALTHLMKFLSSEVASYLYKPTIQPCMEYYCHICTGWYSQL